jgi:hypothetical protein
MGPEAYAATTTKDLRWGWFMSETCAEEVILEFYL